MCGADKLDVDVWGRDAKLKDAKKIHLGNKRDSLEGFQRSDVRQEWDIDEVKISFVGEEKCNDMPLKWADTEINFGQLFYNVNSVPRYVENNRVLKIAEVDDVISSIINSHAARNLNLKRRLMTVRTTIQDEYLETHAYVHLRVFKAKRASAFHKFFRLIIPFDNEYEFHYDVMNQKSDLKSDFKEIDGIIYMIFRCRAYQCPKFFRCQSQIMVNLNHILNIDDFIFTDNLPVLVKDGTHWCEYCKYRLNERFSPKDENYMIPIDLYHLDLNLYWRKVLFLMEWNKRLKTHES